MKGLVFTTALFSGLIAGLFYAYSCSVNPGLRSLSDAEYIKSMQSINIAIQNPLFFICFMSLLLLLPVSAYQLHGQGCSFFLLSAASIIYFIGVFGVTVFLNVPLNEQLAVFSTLTATPDEISMMRQAFEKPWNTYHSIRTIASIASFALAILSIFRQKI